MAPPGSQNGHHLTPPKFGSLDNVESAAAWMVGRVLVACRDQLLPPSARPCSKPAWPEVFFHLLSCWPDELPDQGVSRLGFQLFLSFYFLPLRQRLAMLSSLAWLSLSLPLPPERWDYRCASPHTPGYLKNELQSSFLCSRFAELTIPTGKILSGTCCFFLPQNQNSLFSVLRVDSGTPCLYR